MGNITIAIDEMTETYSSVFSNQVYITNEEIIKANITDSEGYFLLTVSADIKSTEWEFTCKIRIVSSELDTNSFVADVLIEDDGEEIEKEWQLPYNLPLEFKP